MTGKVTVRIENTYEDGHESTNTVEVDAPADPTDLEDWWDEEVFEHTGDGHGEKHPKLGSLHECTVIAGPAEMVGQVMEW